MGVSNGRQIYCNECFFEKFWFIMVFCWHKQSIKHHLCSGFLRIVEFPVLNILVLTKHIKLFSFNFSSNSRRKIHIIILWYYYLTFVEFFIQMVSFCLFFLAFNCCLCFFLNITKKLIKNNRIKCVIIFFVVLKKWLTLAWKNSSF